MLKKINQLYNALNDNGIQHVTWKSLENLDDALNAIDDIDLLCKPEDKNKVTETLKTLCFVEDIYSPGYVYEDITVYRGFDKESCTFIMLHLHFALRLGGKKYKEYRFPFEQEVLDNTQIKKDAVILKDCYFIITRVLQVTVKKAYDDLYTLELSKLYFELGLEEKAIVEKFIKLYFDVMPDQLFNEVIDDGLPVLEKYYVQVCGNFDKHSPIPEAKNKVDKFKVKKSFKYYWAPKIFRRKRNKFMKAYSIVLAGHDGSGKTTTSNEIVKTFNQNCAAKRIYLGRNKWSKLNALINKFRAKKLLKPLELLWPITSTIELFSRYLIGQALLCIGYVIVYDRSLNDLKLKYSGKFILYSWFPLLTWKLSNFIKDKNKFLLIADASVVLKRKGKHEINEIEDMKASYIENLPDFEVIDTSNLESIKVTAEIIEKTLLAKT